MSDLTIEKYIRKPFLIDAVQVTKENMAAVAEWCGGTIMTEKHGREEVSFIFVKVSYPRNERQTKAFVHDWALKVGTGVKLYTPRAFKLAFEKFVPPSRPTPEEIWGQELLPIDPAVVDCEVEGKV